MGNTPLLQLGANLDCDSNAANMKESSIHGSDILSSDISGAKKTNDHFITRDGIEYAGTHLIIDLWGGKNIDDLIYVEETIRRCVIAANATLLHIHLHHFTPNDGISGVAVLAESHISIHSWPEHDYAALDIFLCGDSLPYAAVEMLRECFQPIRLEIHEYLRGRQLVETINKTPQENETR